MNILITGANRGIGLGLAKLYLKQKHNVVLTARKPQEAEAFRALERDFAKQVTLMELDVTHDASVQALATAWGSKPLDLLINNAGVSGSFSAKLGELQGEEGLSIYNTNALGPLRVTQALAPRLHSGSRVVNITSKMGSIADNEQGGSYFYRMSKAALNMGTKCLALAHEKDGIIVAAIHPGWVQTRMGGQSAPITVQESTEHIVRTIEGLSKKHNGAFLNYDGAPIAW